MSTNVKAWVETVVIPTYPTGSIDTNPLFLENRVYQGSSGSVYPYGVIDSISDTKVNKSYQAVYIENDYIKIMLLPELGGRIHSAYDKVKGRDFVYRNDVIKPALVGLLGPWISGGIEFNWPQHHRPTTYMSTDFKIETNECGSVTVWIGEIEHMYGLQIMAGFKLYPNKSLIEITGKVYNTNETPRQFLWWSNPAVKGGNDHQSIFPPDVTAVYDHGKRDVSRFPIATGEYYKVDYSPGTDISRYKNLPVPTSYMADKSDYNFVGAYSHNEQGGLLHVANHHISPGKKQWTWGNCDFGIAWDRQLTDTNGPYIELMTGVFTDNQPDFTWIESHEEKVFVQHFLPYSNLGIVHNANTEVAIKLERDTGSIISWGVYAISDISDYTLKIKDEENKTLFECQLTMMPGEVKEGQFEHTLQDQLTLTVTSADLHSQLSYIEHRDDNEDATPDPATPPAMPHDIESCEELYFIGQHLEQYHHATRSAVDYYQEALKRDPQQYSSNVAMATLAYERADYTGAVTYATEALARAHKFNTNPMCGKASYLRGCANEKLGLLDSAFADVFKATWSGNCRDTGFYAAARIATKQGLLQDALDYIERTLQLNSVHYYAAILKVYLLTKLSRKTEALAFIDQQKKNQPLGYGLAFQQYQATESEQDLNQFKDLMNDREVNTIHLANFYLSIGATEHTQQLLNLCGTQRPMVCIYQAYLSTDDKQINNLLNVAAQQFADNVLFPNTLTEVMILESFTDHYFTQYLLGCFYYAKKDYIRAVSHWEQALALNSTYAPALRNLSVYAFNKLHEPEKAVDFMQQAFKQEPQDARILYELDYLNKINNASCQDRLQNLKLHQSIVENRDDLTAELINLWNINGDLDLAANNLSTRQFHPWEGGEGQITSQFLVNKLRLALRSIEKKQYQEAIGYLESAFDYPHTLGEGRLVGQTDNDIYYYLGWCHKKLGQKERADKNFKQAIQGQQEIGQSRYYNDQPADYLFYQAAALHQLGKTDQASSIYQSMIDWANAESQTAVEVDFFAVSLPALIVFDADLQHDHEQHCLFVKIMGQLGLSIISKQAESFNKEYEQTLQELLSNAPAHTKANLFKELIQHLYVFK